MAYATFFEKENGSAVVGEKVYHSWWFVTLWGAIGVTGIVALLKSRAGRTLPVLLLHLAFLCILGGALVTHLTSMSGVIHLREGRPEAHFKARYQRFWQSSEVQTLHKLPFAVTLGKFSVVNYPGTQAPADYVSMVTLFNENEGTSAPMFISMNRILRSDGYRFYQSSFDPDYQGSWLTVSYDPYGIPITYTGYGLLAFSMLLLLLQPRGTFRRLLAHPLLRKATFLFLMGSLPLASLCAQNEEATSSRIADVLPVEQATQFGKLQALYNGRIVPLQTLARDFTLKLTGSSRYKGFSAEQVFSGWIFYPEEWQYEPLIPLKSKELSTLLNTTSPAPLAAFFDAQRNYKLQEYWGQLHQAGNLSPLQKAITEADERIQLILMLEEGYFLKLFPLTVDGVTNWYSPTDSLPPHAPEEKQRFVTGFFVLLYEGIQEGDAAKVSLLLDKLAVFQQREAGATYLSATKVGAEFVYNRFEPTAWLFRICLTVGLVGFLFMLWNPGSHVLIRRVEKTLRIALWLVFLLLTMTVILRSYVAGRLPLSNGYETMLFLAWAIQLLALWIGRRMSVITVFGFLLSGFTLLVSTLGQMNPQITPLMPVLLSPWLSLHVSLIMTAYALYAFTFLCGITAPLLLWQGRAKEVERLTVLSRLFLYPATFLLGLGIFVGAVWANVSWGTYWSWDPKEVWALISFLVYALPLHATSLSFFRRPLGYHLYVSLAFLTLLMTYFGVNYFLGGMHSYAG